MSVLYASLKKLKFHNPSKKIQLKKGQAYYNFSKITYNKRFDSVVDKLKDFNWKISIQRKYKFDKLQLTKSHCDFFTLF